MKGIRISILSLLGFVVTSSLAQAQTPITIACEQPELAGLYRQCQEVIVLQNVGDRVRVYSKAEKIQLSVSARNLFQATSVSAREILNKDQIISIPAEILWNNTPSEFQSLCRISAKSSLNTVRVSCGRHRDALIDKSKVYRINQIARSASLSVQPTSFYSKK